MPDDTAFLQVICADPDADGPRLRYADYLDEKADPPGAARAEFIRVQCALAAAGPTDPVVSDLATRERALLNNYWPEWLKPACQALAEPTPIATTRVPGERAGASDRYSLSWVNGAAATAHVIEQREGTDLPYFHSGQFRRGFLAHVALIHKTYRSANHVARLFERAPLDGLTFARYPEKDVAATLAAIDATRLRHLELVGGPSEAVRAVAGCPALTHVRELVLIAARGVVDVGDVLGASGVLPGLRSLVLHGCSISFLGLERLARAPFATHLERLELVSCGLNDAAVEVLIGLFPKTWPIRELAVSNDSIPVSGLRQLTDHFGSILRLHATGRPWPVRYYR